MVKTMYYITISNLAFIWMLRQLLQMVSSQTNVLSSICLAYVNNSRESETNNIDSETETETSLTCLLNK